MSRLQSLDLWALGIALAKLALAIAVALVSIRLLRGVLRAAAARLQRSSWLKDESQSLSALVRHLERVVVTLGWMALALAACMILPAPASVTNLLLLVIRIYLAVAVGVALIRSTAIIVDTVDALGHGYARQREWTHYYNQLRPLLPTLRACLEYALWITIASLVIVQFSIMQRVAVWGPPLIQAIGIFFAGRVLIALGHMEVEHRMLPREGIDETERRRRTTMVPLVRSAFTYAVYFGTVVLVLGTLGFNPMPFLAGAGLLGLVIGFGAQSLINDVVSGFFILFENIYLVGDVVEVGAAKGVVEAIEFRTTKIRDGDGRLHVIRNGDMKPVVNYSKEFTVAVVTIDVPYGADLRAVFAALEQAGRRLRAENRDVIDDARVDGITAFGPSTMTVRVAARVRPGRHDPVAAALRLLIKERFDRNVESGPRTTLIGEPHERSHA
jgi:small conductance mechanosensitive channel